MVTRWITPSVVGVIKLIVLIITFFVKCSYEYKFISLHQNAILMTRILLQYWGYHGARCAGKTYLYDK